jgi:uncharacterized protein YcfJ
MNTPLEQHVHAGQPEHGGVEIEAPEHVAPDMVAVRLQQVADIDVMAFFVLMQRLGRGVGAVQVFHAARQEAGGAAGRIAEGFVGPEVDHGDHQVDDVARRAELAVDARGGQPGTAGIRTGRPWCLRPSAAVFRSFPQPRPAAIRF